MITDSGTAFSSAITPELETIVSLDSLETLRFHEGVIYQLTIVIAGNTINVFVINKVSLRNRTVGFTDQFTIFDDRITLSKVFECDFVAVRNILFCTESEKLASILIYNGFSLCNFCDTSHHVVNFVHYQCVDFHGCPPIKLVLKYFFQ